MHPATALLSLTALSSGALAAPAVPRAAAVPDWTIKSFTRTCYAADTTCTVTFAIDTNTGSPATPCSFVVSGSPASRAPTQGQYCGPSYMVGSHWSGQFGDDHGFTVYPVLDYAKNQLAFPSYADFELVNGTAFKPDRSYAVQQFPPRGSRKG